MAKKQFKAKDTSVDELIEAAASIVETVDLETVEQQKQDNASSKNKRMGRPRKNSVHVPEDKTVQFKTNAELRNEMSRWCSNYNMSTKDMLIEGFRLMQKKYGR